MITNRVLTIFVCALALVCAGNCIGRPATADTGAAITIDCTNELGAFENPARGVICDGTELARDRFIDEVGADLLRVNVLLGGTRQDGMGGYIWPWQRGKGASQHMQSIVDDLLRAQERGCRLAIWFAHIPRWLSLWPDELEFYNAASKDLSEYAAFVTGFCAELKRLGLTEIEYLSPYWEPDVGTTWYRADQDPRGISEPRRLREFAETYACAARVLREEFPAAKIGGIGVVGLTPASLWWTRYLAAYARDNAVPFDYVGWQTFGSYDVMWNTLETVEAARPITIEKIARAFSPRLTALGFSESERQTIYEDVYLYCTAVEGADAAALENPLAVFEPVLQTILAEEGYPDIELMLSAWDSGPSPDPRKDTHHNAAYIARFLMNCAELGRPQTYYHVSHCKAWCSLDQCDDRGFCQESDLFTGCVADGSPQIETAGFNAFVAFSKLGDGTRLAAETDTASDHVFAVKKSADEFGILICHDGEAKPPVQMTIDMPISWQRWSWSEYRIDHDTSNAYFGSGPGLQQTGSGESTGTVGEFLVSLPDYSVVLYQFSRLEDSAPPPPRVKLKPWWWLLSAALSPN